MTDHLNSTIWRDAMKAEKRCQARESAAPIATWPSACPSDAPQEKWMKKYLSTEEAAAHRADAPRAACELYLEAVELRVRRVVGVFEALAAHHMRGGEWHLAEATWLREYDRGGARLRRRLSQRARDSIDAGRRLAREVGAAGEAARTGGSK